jgi:hypothetical protein
MAFGCLGDLVSWSRLVCWENDRGNPAVEYEQWVACRWNQGTIYVVGGSLAVDGFMDENIWLLALASGIGEQGG